VITRSALCATLALCLFASVSWANRVRGGLERFELATLKVFAISKPRADGSRVAFIEDAEHYVYRVEAGDYLGKRDGRISRIKNTEIVVVEVVKDGDSYRESTVVLKCDEWCQTR